MTKAVIRAGATARTQECRVLANANHCNQLEQLVTWVGSAAVANVFVACARMMEPYWFPVTVYVTTTTSARVLTCAPILIHGTDKSKAAVASARIGSMKVVAVTKTRIARTAGVASATLAHSRMGNRLLAVCVDATAIAIKAGATGSTKYTKACFAPANA